MTAFRVVLRCLMLVGACALAALVSAQAPAATLSVVRQVEVTKAPNMKTKAWMPAKHGQGILTGYGVQTLKRSKAELKFKDGSILRLNERTEVAIHDVAEMRKIHLQQGAVWVHVAKGANTSVETPSCTATARGTTFVVVLLPNGRVRVVVFDGVVEVAVGGQTVTLHGGQSTETTGGGEAGGGSVRPGDVETLGQADMPVELGGTVIGWWEDVPSTAGLAVTSGTDVVDDLRRSGVAEEPLSASAPTHPPFYIPDAAARNDFLAVANHAVVHSVEAIMQADGITLAEFRQRDGHLTLSHWGMPPGDLAHFESLGITTLDQAIEAILVNGGAITVDVRGRQAQFQPGASTISQSSLRLLDRTESSIAVLAAGLGLGLIADWGDLTVSAPRFGALFYGFSGHPGFLGGRGEARGVIGRTRYTVEANALKFTNGPASDWATRVGSVAVVEHNLTDSLVAFAGRKRYYHGPVFQNQVATQLIADRYSGVGLRWRHDRLSLEGAWLYDSNGVAAGAQRGALLTAAYRAGGGVFGLHLLEAGGVRDGHGRTLSVAYPLLPNRLETYGEVGTGVDDATLQTYGLYFPSLYQRFDVDLFLEYGHHEQLGEAFSAVAVKPVNDDGELRAYVTRQDSAWVVGAAAIWRFGSYAAHAAGDVK